MNFALANIWVMCLGASFVNISHMLFCFFADVRVIY